MEWMLPATVIYLTSPLVLCDPAETEEIYARSTAIFEKSAYQPSVLHSLRRYTSEEHNKAIIAGKQAGELQERTTTLSNSDRFVYSHPLNNNTTLYIKHVEVGIPSDKESVTGEAHSLTNRSECLSAKKEHLNITNLPKIKRGSNVSEELNMHNKTINETDGSGVNSVLEVKRYVDVTFVLLICLPAMVGNILILIIFIRHAEMRTISNIYIFTIAVGDLLCIIINLIFFLLLFLLSNQHWNLGTYFCKFFFSASDLSVALSIFGLTALSVQRYCGILSNPFVSSRSQFCFSKRMKVYQILFVWTASFLLALRTFITADVVHGRCESVTDHELSKFIAIVNFIIFALFPLLLLTIFHALTARYLFACARKIPGDDSRKQSALKHAREKSARIVLALIFVFFTSYVPWFLWQIIFLCGNFEGGDKRVLYSFWILYYLFFGSVCFNPIALYCISTSFRRLFQHYLCSCGFCKVSIQWKTERRKEDIVTETSLALLEVSKNESLK